jgi:hypothetical protein
MGFKGLGEEALAMAARTEEPIRFRCYRCNKLLGVPARKVGSTVSCPQCQAELQVPRLEAAVAPSIPSGALEGAASEGAAAEVAEEPAPSPPVVAIPADFPAGPSEAASAVDDAVLVAIQVDPPSIRRDPDSAGSRPQDVVLSPVIVLAWSLLVLMAVPLAFIAGLLAGHFVWK